MSVSRGPQSPGSSARSSLPKPIGRNTNNFTSEEMRMKRKGRRGEDGAAAVEMAIVLSLLFILLFGIVESAFIFNRWIQVTHAAREGVRELSIGVPLATAETNAEATDGSNTAKFGADAINCTASSAPDPNNASATVVQM